MLNRQERNVVEKNGAAARLHTWHETEEKKCRTKLLLRSHTFLHIASVHTLASLHISITNEINVGLWPFQSELVVANNSDQQRATASNDNNNNKIVHNTHSWCPEGIFYIRCSPSLHLFYFFFFFFLNPNPKAMSWSYLYFMDALDRRCHVCVCVPDSHPARHSSSRRTRKRYAIESIQQQWHRFIGLRSFLYLYRKKKKIIYIRGTSTLQSVHSFVRAAPIAAGYCCVWISVSTIRIW